MKIGEKETQRRALREQNFVTQRNNVTRGANTEKLVEQVAVASQQPHAATNSKRGRSRIHASNADRQKAYRSRNP